ncbi:unnamed protein product [Pleuronectes platessa]|uniref:Uncharacterized protein n=1 Tax=Pleuronectes platessa TaxID=8262 RepID=A0A9N7U852_PLEPL|nr:unnamed protein product [Pleuronectes platessa]
MESGGGGGELGAKRTCSPPHSPPPSSHHILFVFLSGLSVNAPAEQLSSSRPGARVWVKGGGISDGQADPPPNTHHHHPPATGHRTSHTAKGHLRLHRPPNPTTRQAEQEAEKHKHKTTEILKASCAHHTESLNNKLSTGENEDHKHN